MKSFVMLLSLLQKSISGAKFTLEEHEVMDKARKDKINSGLGHVGNQKGCISIPISFRSESDEFWDSRNARNIGTEGYLIGNEQKYIINPITEKSVFTEAGALYWPSQSLDVKVPSFSGAENILVSWVADGGEPADDGNNITLSGAAFSPKRIYACLDIPIKLIQQGGVEAEKWLRDCITAAISNKIDSTLGGILASSAIQPQGMGYAVNQSNAIAPKYSHIVALEESLGDLNVPLKNLGFITTAKGRRILRKIYKDEAAGGEPVYKDGKINDYNAFFSNQLSNQAGADGLGSLLLHGYFPDLCIVQFGAYDITADPFILKNKGKIQLTINSYWDFKGLRGAKDGNDYAYSFAALAIKE